MTDKIIDFKQRKESRGFNKDLEKTANVLNSAFEGQHCGYVGTLAFVIGFDNILRFLKYGCQTQEQFDGIKQNLKGEMWDFLNKLAEVERENK